LIDDDNLRDSPGTKWEPELIARYIAKHCKSVETKYDIIISFDKYGVNGNTKNCAISEAISHLMSH